MAWTREAQGVSARASNMVEGGGARASNMVEGSGARASNMARPTRFANGLDAVHKEKRM